MTDEKFQEQAIAAYKAEVIDIVREVSTVRKIFPVNEAIAASDNTYVYYKLKESSQIQYNYEAVTPKYNVYATEKVSEPIPYLQGDLSFSRHERGRLAKDVVPIDIRTRALIADLNEEEEKICYYGHKNFVGGETGFTDTTNMATTATDEFDLGTYLEGKQHFYASVSQLRTLLKNKMVGGKLKIVWTTDVDDRAKAIAHTYNGETFYEWVIKELARFNGSNGYDDLVVSNYLDSETNAGTVNTLMVYSAPHLQQLITSPIEIVQGDTPQGDLQIQIGWRFRPLAYVSNDSAIIHVTTVLT